MEQALLVSQTSAIKTPRRFLGQTPIAERLIYPGEAGVLYHAFEQGLRAMPLNWRPWIRVNSFALMRGMMAGG
ncbi:MAG: hypothetical protein ABI273_12405 [Lacunisphaera sp.]